MLYDNYKNKIQKVAKVKNVLVFLRFVFLSIFILVALFVVTFITSKGKLKKGIVMPSSINYGDDYNFDVETYFGGGLKYFEYREESSTEWTTEKPIKAGTYYVRAVTNKFAGSRKSSEYKFTINKTNLDINITSDTITYGDYPAYSATGLKNSDRITQLSFIFDSYDSNKTNINIELNSVVINDTNGSDLTDSYNITVNGKEVSFNKKDITINPTIDKEFVYSGEEVKYQNTYTINTNLGYSDISIVEGKICDLAGNETSAVLPGEYMVKLNKVTINHGNTEVTNNYNVKIDEEKFRIVKKDILVETKSAAKTYDGANLSNNEFVCSGLVKDDYAVLTTTVLPEITNYIDGGIKNILEVKICDKDGNDVTNDLYNLTYNYGTLVINKKPITISTTSDNSFVYTGSSYSRCELSDIFVTSGSLVTTDHIELGTGVQPSISEPGEVINAIDFDIYNDSGIKVTSSYAITENYGILKMDRTGILIEPIDISVKYGEDYSIYEDKCFNIVGAPEELINDIRNNTTVEVEYYQNGNVKTPKNAGIYDIKIKNYHTSNKYDISVLPNSIGKLTIVEKDIYIRLNDFNSQYIYDGNAIEYSDSFGNYTLVSGSRLEYDDSLKIMVDYYDNNDNYLDGLPVNVGTYKVKYKSYINSNTIDSKDSNYIIHPQNEPTILITERDIRLELEPLSKKEYDYTPYDYSNEKYTLVGSLVDGHRLDVEYGVYLGLDKVTPINANNYELRIKDINVYDSNNINQTSNYNISYTSYVELIISRRKVELSFKDINNKEYDGVSIDHYSEDYNNFNIISGSIISNDRLKINYRYYDVNNSSWLYTDPVNAGKYYISVYNYEIDGYSADYNNYEFTCEDKNFEITKRYIEIKPNDFELTFGDTITYNQNSYTYVSGNHLLDGEALYVSSVEYYQNNVSTTPKNVGTYTVRISGIWGTYNGNNYQIVYNNSDDYATLTINKKVVNIRLLSINTDNTKTFDGIASEYELYYGNYESLITLPYSHHMKVYAKYQKFVNDSYQDINQMIDVGTYKVIYSSFDIDEANNNGNYEVICDNYIIFTITKKHVEINLAPKTITYGEQLVYPEDLYTTTIDLEFVIGEYVSLTALVNNGIDYATKTSNLHVGSYEISATIKDFYGRNIDNYTINIVSSSLTVIKREIEIKLGDSQKVTFDGSNHHFDETNFTIIGNLVNNDLISITLNHYLNDVLIINPRNVGSYLVSVNEWTISGGVGNNYDYDVTTITSWLIIDKKEVILDINSCSMIYGSTSYPIVQFTARNGYNFISGDTVTLNTKFYYSNGIEIDIELSKLHVTPNNYLIKGTVDEFITSIDSNIDNYNITINQAVFTIEQRYIEIVLTDSAYIEYDAQYHEYNSRAFSVIEGNIVNDDDITITVTYSNLGDEPMPINVNKYTVTYLSYKNNEIYNDYNVKCTDTKTIEIYKKEVTLTINNYSSEYNGDYVDASTIAYTLGIYIRDVSKVIVEVSFDEDLSKIKNVGLYSIKVDITDNSNNYIISYINEATYEITKRNITISPSNIANRTYNGSEVSYSNKEGNYKVIEGAIVGEKFKVSVLFYDSFDNAWPTVIDADIYRVSIYNIYDTDSALQSNYNITTVDNNFEITKQIIKVMPLSMESKIYRNEAYSYNNEFGNFDVKQGPFYNSDENDYRISVKFYDSPSKTNEVEPKNAGKYYVFVDEIEGYNKNYDVSAYNSFIIFEIEKYILNIAFINSDDYLLPNDKKEYDGIGYYYPTNGTNDNCNHSNVSFENITVVITPQILDSNNKPYTEAVNVGKYKLVVGEDNFIVYVNGVASSNYQINGIERNFEILQKDIRIIINSISSSPFTYTGSAVIGENANGFTQLDDLIGSETLQVKFKYQQNNIDKDPINVGTYNVVKDYYTVNYDESNNYNIIVTNVVSLTIIKQELTIYTSSKTDSIENFIYVYDETPFDSSLVKAYSVGLVNGHSLTINRINYYDSEMNKLQSNPIDVGNYYVKVMDVIVRKGGLDVTSNYEINYMSYASLSIVSEKITISLKSPITEKIYGDKVLKTNVELTLINSEITSELGIEYLKDTNYKFALDLKYEYNGEEVDPRDCKNYDILIDKVYIWYRNNLKDSSMFNISLVENTKLIISKKTINIYAATGQANNSKNYDGIKYNVTLDKYTIKDANGNIINLPYDDETLELCTLIKDSNKNPYTGDILHYGVYYVSIDPTSLVWSRSASNYDFTLYDTQITINKAIIKVSVEDDDLEYEYDGNNKDKDLITSTSYSILVNGKSEFINDEEISLLYYVSYEPFDMSLYRSMAYYYANLASKELCNAGLYTINCYDYIVNGERTDYILQIDSSNLNVIINRIELSIKTGSYEGIYDGQSHKNEDEFILLDGHLIPGHAITVDHRFDVPEVVDVTDKPVQNIIHAYVYNETKYIEEGLIEELGFNYVVSIDDYGTLVVTKKTLTITVNNIIEYDYIARSQSKIKDSDILSIDGLVSGEYVKDVELNSSVKDAGNYNNRKLVVQVKKSDLTDSTKNYEIVVNDFTVKVNKKIVRFELEAHDFYYNTESYQVESSDFIYEDIYEDENGFYDNDMSIVEISFFDLEGHSISEFIDAGVYELTIDIDSFDIKNSSGSRLFNYDWTITNINDFTIDIQRRKIRVTTDSSGKFFDGEDLYNYNYYVNGKYESDNADEYADQNDLDSLNHRVILGDLAYQPFITYPEESPVTNYLELLVVDEFNNDITNNYDLKIQAGILTISNNMDISSSYTNRYTGQPLSYLISLNSINNYIKTNMQIGGVASDQEVRFVLNDYVILFREKDTDKFVEAYDYVEIGTYRLYLLDFNVYINDEDITYTFDIDFGENMINNNLQIEKYYGIDCHYIDFSIIPIDLYIRPKSSTSGKKELIKEYDGYGVYMPINFYEDLTGALLPGHTVEVYAKDAGTCIDGCDGYLDGSKVTSKKIKYDETETKVVFNKYDGSQVDVSKYYNIHCTWDTVEPMKDSIYKNYRIRVTEANYTMTLRIDRRTIYVVMPTEEAYYYDGIESDGIYTVYDGSDFILNYDSQNNIYLQEITDTTGLINDDYIKLNTRINGTKLFRCGNTTNRFRDCYHIYDINGNIVDSNYNVKTVEGASLIIKPSITITFKSGTTSKVYDGTGMSYKVMESITIFDINNPETIYDFDDYMSSRGLTYEVTEWVITGKKVGEYDNTFKLTFYKDENRITESSLKTLYGIEIKPEYGTITITEKI